MSDPSRRKFLRNSGGLGIAAIPGFTGCAHRQFATPAPIAAPSYLGADSLKAHAAARGFLYGSAVDTRALKNDEAYRRLLQSQCNIVVAENAMKWSALRPTMDTYNFTEADELVAFAEQNRMKVRGHNLCWHESLPHWFTEQATAENARRLLTEHIAHVAGRYAGRMQSWDVVNEAIDVKDGRADGLRNSPWLKLVGADYIEVAFKAAREADPQALLTYNDYGIEGEDNESQAKRIAVLTLLRRMRARHIPLDAVGIQSHITGGKPYGAGLREFMSAAREMGLQIFITELDVNDRALPPDITARDQAVAETYSSYLKMVLQEPAVRVVLTWGITDGNTWLNHKDSRKDGLPERCLPFASDNLPKPAFFAMREAFDSRRTLPQTAKAMENPQ